MANKIIYVKILAIYIYFDVPVNYCEKKKRNGRVNVPLR